MERSRADGDDKDGDKDGDRETETQYCLKTAHVKTEHQRGDP